MIADTRAERFKNFSKVYVALYPVSLFPVEKFISVMCNAPKRKRYESYCWTAPSPYWRKRKDTRLFQDKEKERRRENRKRSDRFHI
jgi:hypothetical protein